jgi:hypothetical protein
MKHSRWLIQARCRLTETWLDLIWFPNLIEAEVRFNQLEKSTTTMRIRLLRIDQEVILVGQEKQ